jgi:hypothetical protein
VRTQSNSSAEVTIREAAAGDAVRLRRLAALDSSRLGAGPFLVAEAGGQLRAALSLADRSVVADPFVRTSELAALLRMRASQLAA